MKYFHFIIILIICTLVYTAYFPAFDNDFVFWDDQYYIIHNSFINPPTLDSFMLLMSKIISLNYHPLTMASLWLNAFISGVEEARPFIITNVILHILNSIFVYLLLLQVFKQKYIIALIASLLFAVHPMHVESVAWVSERKDVLYSLFYLLSLIAYLKYIDGKRIKWYFGSLILFLFSTLSKGMAVSLVPIVFLLDLYNNRSFSNLNIWIEKLPFLVLSLLFGLITIDVQGGGDFYGMLERTTSEAALIDGDYSLFDLVKHGLFGIGFYIQNFTFPDKLSAFHPYSITSNDRYLIEIIIYGILFLLFTIWSFFKNRQLFFGCFFFIATIFLVLQFIPVGSAIVAERYSYLPYVGLGSIVGLGFQYLWERINIYLIGILMAIITLPLLIVTRSQVETWQNSVSLFENVVKCYPEDPMSRRFLASAYWQDKKYALAIENIEYAINYLGSVNSSSFELLANCYADSGDTGKAVAFYNEALNLDSTDLVARYHRAILLVDINPKQAIDDLSICEKAQDEYVKQLVFAPRARAYGLMGQFEHSLEDFNVAIRREPYNPSLYIDRGITNENLRNTEMAIHDYRKALELDPGLEFATKRINLLQPKD